MTCFLCVKRHVCSVRQQFDALLEHMADVTRREELDDREDYLEELREALDGKLQDACEAFSEQGA